MIYEVITPEEKEAKELLALARRTERNLLRDAAKKANDRAIAAEQKAAKKDKQMRQLVAGIGVFTMLALIMILSQNHPFWYCGFPILGIVYLMRKAGWL